MGGGTFSTHIRDSAVQKEKEREEELRGSVLSGLQVALSQAPVLLPKALIFGSLTCPGRFRSESDVDVAVHEMSPRDYFTLKCYLEGRLMREVDLVELERVRFSDAILRRGMTWTSPSS